jgi:hypothetical protein
MQMKRSASWPNDYSIVDRLDPANWITQSISGGFQMTVPANRSATVSARFSVKDLVAKADVFLQVWPVYSLRNKERAHVGFELELLGSHSPDPTHLDPSCPKCSRLRSALYDVACHLAHEANLNSQGPLFCTVTSPSSIVCLQRYNNRAFVQISMEIQTCSDRSISPSDIGVINELRTRIRETGIQEP